MEHFFNAKSWTELLQEILTDMPSVKLHILTTNKHVRLISIIRQIMTADTLALIEDYQMNINIQSWELPKAILYTANKNNSTVSASSWKLQSDITQQIC